MNMIAMYNKVFQDMVKCYLENMEEEDKTKLTEEEIEDIAYKMIYRNDYLWEIINETIDMYIGKILNKED